MSASPDQKPHGSVRIEDGMLVIRMPLAEAHGLRVALAECPCRAPKSTETMNIRQRISKAIGIATRRIK